MTVKLSPHKQRRSKCEFHIALPETSAVMGSVVSVVRRSNGVDGTIDVIDRIEGLGFA